MGQILKQMNFVTEKQLETALKKQKEIFDANTPRETQQRAKIVHEARLASENFEAPMLGKILIEMK